MIFSRATTHALRALAAMDPQGPLRPAKELAEELGLPSPYLAKVFQPLAQAGILESVRGPRGGFRLARDPGTLTVWDIVKLFEMGEPLGDCILGLAHCGRSTPCPMHGAWLEARALLEQRLGGIPLVSLQASFQAGQQRAGQ